MIEPLAVLLGLAGAIVVARPKTRADGVRAARDEAEGVAA